jgi:hypothetical protein
VVVLAVVVVALADMAEVEAEVLVVVLADTEVAVDMLVADEDNTHSI